MKQIQTTTSYGKFVLAGENRPIRLKKVERLRQAMERKNLSTNFPIIVSKNGKDKYVIIDGQHRFLANVQLKAPIFYINAKDDISIDEVAEVNTLQDKWNHTDYLHHFTKKGMHEYKVLEGFMRRYGFGLTTSLAMLTGSKGNRTDEFRAGNIVTTNNLTQANKHAERIHELGTHVSFFKTRSFVLACFDMFKRPDYDHERMVGKLDYLSHKLVRCANKEDYLGVLEEIYNFKAQGNKVRFS